VSPPSSSDLPLGYPVNPGDAFTAVAACAVPAFAATPLAPADAAP
jgi:hypothetical protein